MYKNDGFIKTRPGQTKGKLKNRPFCCRFAFVTAALILLSTVIQVAAGWKYDNFTMIKPPPKVRSE